MVKFFFISIIRTIIVPFREEIQRKALTRVQIPAGAYSF